MKVLPTTVAPGTRVGIVMPLASQKGGAESLLLHLLRRADQPYTSFLVFLEPGPLADEARALGYDTTIFPATRLANPLNYFSVVSGLRRWMRDRMLDVVLSWMPKAQLYVSVAALFTRVQVLWYQHCIPGTHPMDRLATLLPASAVLCCSEASMRAQEGIFPYRKTLLCYPGVVLERSAELSKQEARLRLGLPLAGPVVGMVARLERWKGAHIFVAAAPHILREYPEATMFIVGGAHPLDPEYAATLEARVKGMGNGQGGKAAVLLAGQRAAGEIPLWQIAADVIVHPVTGPEPFGMAVVEAMGRGRVVIASDLGGPSEIIEDQVNGVLIGSGDPEALARSVLQYLADAEQRERVETAARLRSRCFSVEVFATRFADLVVASLTPGRRTV